MPADGEPDIQVEILQKLSRMVELLEELNGLVREQLDSSRAAPPPELSVDTRRPTERPPPGTSSGKKSRATDFTFNKYIESILKILLLEQYVKVGRLTTSLAAEISLSGTTTRAIIARAKQQLPFITVSKGAGAAPYVRITDVHAAYTWLEQHRKAQET